MDDRELIKNLINKIENEYDVTNWRHNGYYIWPIFRMSLYLYLVNKNVTVNCNVTSRGQFINKLGQAIFAIKDLFILKKSSNIFVSHPTYCFEYQDVVYNKYFDNLMDDISSSSICLNRSDTKEKYYKSERHYLFSNSLRVYRYLKNKFKFQQSRISYITEFCKILQRSKIDIDLNEFESSLIATVRKVEVSLEFSTCLLKKIQPERIWVSCYYSTDLLGLLIAAHKLSITTIDMQHGGQGEDHLAYSSWLKVPETGYEALPDLFYTWDESSARTINYWAKNNTKHSAEVFGNPWVVGWQDNKFHKSKYIWPDNIILYTLQPIGEPLDRYILETIKRTQNTWNWWLRLHPRQMNEKEFIIKKLKEFNLEKVVNVSDASNLPLPEILMHSKVHITKFSGSALEAYQFDVPTVIIDLKGKQNYNDYICRNDKMVASLSKDSNNFQSAIESVYS